MKYEAVFGNQELFDGAGTFTGLDVVVHSIASGIKSYARLSDLTPESLRNHPVCAMRRIIKEPKRWTVEDQKAGRLPEVGWVVRATGVNEDARIAAINNDAVCVVFEDGGFITLHVSGIEPIETPAEKAQREEDEFVESTCRQNEPHSTLYSDGVRAAYRKLKGGE
jgi:hypothetical protein